MSNKYPSHQFFPPLRDEREKQSLRDRLPVYTGTIMCDCGCCFGYATKEDTIKCRCGREYTA